MGKFYTIGQGTKTFDFQPLGFAFAAVFRQILEVPDNPGFHQIRRRFRALQACRHSPGKIGKINGYDTAAVRGTAKHFGIGMAVNSYGLFLSAEKSSGTQGQYE